ncbi:MAG: hypothetical protein R3F02_16325 [Thiolinea sp.]
MTMQAYTFTLKPLSAFATELKGDTLFGQLCWAIRNRFGEARLIELLQGYTDGLPFAVVSDAFPRGHVPKPTVPNWFFADADPEQRKLLKKKIWMPLEQIGKPLPQWQQACKAPGELFPEPVLEGKPAKKWQMEDIQPHNTINRMTGTTGTGEFAPYSMTQHWFKQDVLLDCHIVLDTEKLPLDELNECLQDIGHFGFGKDATIGAGKFELAGEPQPMIRPVVHDVDVCLTLAPCAPQGLGFDTGRSFYQPFTRFGRHGDIAVHKEGKPFKNPVLLAQTGAIMGASPDSLFIGQGLGGTRQKLSNAIDATVHQGYAPVLPVCLSAAITAKLDELEQAA